MPDQRPPYSVSHEVRNGNIGAIREICERIQLDSDITRFRIEIESETPIITADSAEGEANEKPKSESEAVESGFQKFDEKDTKVLSHTDEKDPSAGTFNKNSNKWKLAAFLYRQNEPIRLGHIEAYLEGTEWEIAYKTISATLSDMKSSGLVKHGSIPGSNYNGWELSEEGEHRMQNTIDEADKYILTTADKIAGLHPSNNYEQPDLEA